MSCIVFPLVVDVFIGNGVSPLIEVNVTIGTVVDSFFGVSCIVSEVGCCVFWVVFAVCIGVGLS